MDIYYAEFFDDTGEPHSRKPRAFYSKLSEAKTAIANTLKSNHIFRTSSNPAPVGARLYIVESDLTLIDEYGTIVEHVDGQQPLFEL